MTAHRKMQVLARAAAGFFALVAIPAWAQVKTPPCSGLKDCNVETPKVSADPRLPEYRANAPLKGRLRIFGSPLGGLIDSWVAEFRKHHPSVRFDNAYPSSEGAVAGMMAGGADIGSSGREAMLADFLGFAETFNYGLVEAAVATGTYNVRGRTPSVVIYVHKDNPISRLTIDQLDGIFGSERTGGYEGFMFRTEHARGPEKNIRTWGQLGLRGDWADKTIRTHGYAWTGMTNYFQRVVFKGGDKFNPNYQQYVESFTKMVPHGDYGAASSQLMLEQIAKDKFAIAWSFIPQADRMRAGGVKAVALGTSPSGPFYLPNLENTFSRKYPLTRSIFFYLKKPPTGVDPLTLEFMRFVYSRQGQAVVAAHGAYLPLPAEAVSQEMAKLK